MKRRTIPTVQHASARARRSASTRSRRSASACWAALCLLCAVAWAGAARAQSCPSSYSACDNGGCCLASDQCCPRMSEGCCPGATPYCCGDGTCAAAPAECGNSGRNTCNGYDIPCGGGCAPAGSHCCDLVGHYCPPQGVCTSETACLAGEQVTVASLVFVPDAPDPMMAPERLVSPLIDPPHGTERSCSFRPAEPSRTPLGSLASLGALVALCALRRNAQTPRS